MRLCGECKDFFIITPLMQKLSLCCGPMRRERARKGWGIIYSITSLSGCRLPSLAYVEGRPLHMHSSTHLPPPFLLAHTRARTHTDREYTIPLQLGRYLFSAALLSPFVPLPASGFLSESLFSHSAVSLGAFV